MKYLWIRCRSVPYFKDNLADIIKYLLPSYALLSSFVISGTPFRTQYYMYILTKLHVYTTAASKCPEIQIKEQNQNRIVKHVIVNRC